MIKNSVHIPDYKALVRYARILNFEDIHTKFDKETGLFAIVAIHSTKLGPAIGGCRCFSYAAPELALKDALRLAYAMTLKAAACGLPHGGAKSVILKPAHIKDRTAFFHRFADFVHDLNGRYITAIDVGTGVEDMTIIADRTPFVIGATTPDRVDTDPSPSTALGVFRSIQAAVQFKWRKDTLDGLHVAVQGVGKVGFGLAEYLVNHGAKVTVADVNADNVDKCVKSLKVNKVSPSEIDQIDCDIFSPCAMGGAINLPMIHRNKASIIAGAANNQLAHRKYAHVLAEKGVLYLPDFFINAGGLINAAMVYTYQDLAMAEKKVNTLYDNTMHLITRAASTGKTTTRIAEEIARERLQ